MDLNLLINISSDTENLYGIQFFTSFFQTCKGINVTLFHICQIKKQNHSQHLLDSWTCPDDAEAKPVFSARRALEKAEKELRQNHVCSDIMTVKTIKERFGTVKDILNESETGLYDAMILGRRATYSLQGLFDRRGEEIPQAIVDDGSLACPLWLCSEPEPGRKNILLCLDGSKSSLRAADHVGFILNQAKTHTVTLFHVSMSGGSIDKIFAEAEKILHFHKIEAERIHTKKGWGLSVPGAILAEAEHGKYAAVAVGLHGVSHSRILENIGLQAGLTTTLLRKTSKSTLWCIP